MRGGLPVLILSAAIAGPFATTAGAADRMGQKAGTTTALGTRLAPFAARHDQPLRRDAFWSDVHRTLEASDAKGDAEDDTARGHTGLMTHANETAIEPRLAPGLKCFDRSEPARRAVFFLAYSAPLTSAAGRALLAFDVYARAYNRAVLKSGALGETSCRDVNW